MSFLERIAQCNVFEPSRYRPLRVGGVEVGLVRHDIARRLGEFAEVFTISEAALDLCGTLDGLAARTAAVEAVLRRLSANGEIRGWRDEPYPVATSFTAPPLLHMERAGVPMFGIRAYGVHMNGYVRDGDSLEMWVARRSLAKFSAPGKLDQMVAGGQPVGISLRDNLVKESAEEADIPPELAGRAVPVGAISYTCERPEGLRRDELFVYDLEVPADFEPRNTDGEIDGFELWPVDRVMESVRETDDFKFNCALVNIDFLIRHGYIEPDHPDYMKLLKGLRS